MGFVINSKGFSCRPDKGNARGAHGSVARADSQITSAPKPMAKVGHMERKLHQPTGPNGQAHEDFSRTGNNGEVPRPFSMSKGLDASWLPAALQEIQSSSQTGLSDGSLLPAVLATAGTAMGSSAVLQSQLFSMPVNASIQALIYCQQGHRLKGAIDEITKPLGFAQDERLVERGEVRAKDIEKQTRRIEKERETFFSGSPVRDPKLESSFTFRINQLKRLRYLALLTENPRPGTLYAAAVRSGGKGLLSLYDESAFRHTLDCPKKASQDFDLLAAAYAGKTPEQSILSEPKAAPLIRPSVGCIVSCSASTLAQLVCMAEPQVCGCINQWVLANAEDHSWSAGFAPDPSGKQFVSWAPLIRRLLAFRDLGEQRTLTLSSDAAALLTEYQRESQQLGSQETRWTNNGPLLSAKIALILHVCGAETGREVSVSCMRHAIGLAKKLVEQTAAAARACVADEQSKAMIGEAARMLEKLQRVEPATARTLFKMYDNSSKSLRQPVLDYLVRSGQVLLRPDGMLESLPKTSSIKL